MTTTIIYIVSGLIALWIIGNLFTSPLQHHFIMWPKKVEQDHEYHFYIPFEEHFIDTPNGGFINVLHFRNLGKAAKGVVVYYHGNADNLIRWGHAGEFFEKYGYEVIIYDYRGYGKSTGELNESTFYSDAEAIYQYAAKHYLPEQIVIYGRSLGSGPSSYVASRNKVNQLILETPFSSIKDLFYAYYPFFPPVFMFNYIFPVKKHLKDVDVPITIFHGTDDFIVPLRCAKKNIPSLKPEDEFIIIQDAAHGDVSHQEEYSERLKELLD